MIICPNCHSINIFGMYKDVYYGEDGYEPYWTWEPANSKTSLEPQLYDRFSCEDCNYKWEGGDNNDVRYT